MDENQMRSRARANKKKRTNQLFIILLIIGLAIFLFLAIPLMNKDKSATDTDNNNSSIVTNDDDENNQNNYSNDENNENKTNDENEDTNNAEDDNETNDNEEADSFPSIFNEQDADEIDVTSGDDDNIIESYTANWPAIGTKQTGEHNSSFDENSADRKEIEEAITAVTGFSADEYILWWIGNDGFDKAYTDIEVKDTAEVYRLYYTWVKDKGWKVTKVDHMKSSEHQQ